ncbi:hypothetical protein OG21DRAFT_1606138 [Imleria badia]|nr:hypothetical protein OG21DRAFT_1606138 [Imleria badia]
MTHSLPSYQQVDYETAGIANTYARYAAPTWPADALQNTRYKLPERRVTRLARSTIRSREPVKKAEASGKADSLGTKAADEEAVKRVRTQRTVGAGEERDLARESSRPTR